MPSASLVKEFETLIGKENVFTSEADRQSYAYDAAVLPSVVPGLVLRPTHTEQLGALIERCYANGLPMTRTRLRHQPQRRNGPRCRQVRRHPDAGSQ